MSSLRARLLFLAPLFGACATADLAHVQPNVAFLAGEGVTIDGIDDRSVRDDTGPQARFELPAGAHTVTVSLRTPSSRPGEDAPVIAVCFTAEAGHSYVSRAVVENGQWHPVVLDEDTGALVQRACAVPAVPPPATAEAPAEQKPATAPTEEKPATAEAPPEERPATAQAPPEERPATAQAPATAAPPSPAPTPAAEQPPAPAPTALPVPVRREPAHATDLPGTGVTLELGFFFGGDSLYDVMFEYELDRSLSAGRGVQLAAGGMWTPLWVDERIGFGVGGSFGWKYDTIGASNGSASLTRLPLSATAHGLFRLNYHWFALLRGGLATELGGHLSGTGFAEGIDSDLTARLGLMADAGLYYDFRPVALGGGLRYTSLSDKFKRSKVDASSLGIVAFGQYGF